MRVIRVVPSLAIATAVVVLVSGVLSIARGEPGSAVAQESLTVIEHATTDTVTDLGDEGDSMGDTLSFSNELYDAEDANVVGNSNGSCVRTAPGKTWECTWTNTFDNGSIVVQGPFYDTADSVLAITAGTGQYSGASGEMELKARDGGTKYEFIFTID